MKIKVLYSCQRKEILRQKNNQDRGLETWRLECLDAGPSAQGSDVLNLRRGATPLFANSHQPTIPKQLRCR
jgi:hypothetical protein